MMFAALALSVMALAAACRQSSKNDAEGVQIEFAFEPAPASSGEATLLVTVKDKAGEPITDAVVEAKGDMNHAGMTPVLGASTEADANGQYAVPFNWTMGGDWIVTIIVTLQDNSSLKQQFELTVGGDGGMPGMGVMDMTLPDLATPAEDCAVEDQTTEDDTGDCAFLPLPNVGDN